MANTGTFCQYGGASLICRILIPELLCVCLVCAVCEGGWEHSEDGCKQCEEGFHSTENGACTACPLGKTTDSTKSGDADTACTGDPEEGSML